MNSPGADFVKHLMSAMPTPEARLRLGAALVAYEGCTVYLPVGSKAARRIRAAQNMLANRLSAPDAVDAIRQRFGVSRRTAERDVNAARKLSEKTVAI